MKKWALLSAGICLSVLTARGQGCSDAGACTLGPMKYLPEAADAGADSVRRESSFISGVSVGVGEEKVIHITPFAELNVQLFRNTFLHLRVPFQANLGDISDTWDVGDFFGGFSQRLVRTESADLRVLAAVKLPQNRANERSDAKNPAEQLPLPMSYQSSLGTYDLIGGASVKLGKWHASAAYQHVFKNINQNGYVQQIWLGNEDGMQYFNSRSLHRANDVLLRVERAFNLFDNQLVVGVLPIYHLSEDSYETLSGERLKIKGSDGLTLNLTASYLQRLSDRSGLRITVGAPAITRDARPEGLTRFAVGMVNYELRF